MVYSDRIYKIPEVVELIPAFDGSRGWITAMELNFLDPNCNKYRVIEEATFEDDTVFMLVQKC